MASLRDVSQHSRRVLDRAFYDDVRSADRQLRERFVVSPLGGRGFIVSKGQTFRVKQEAGPQVGVVAFWNAYDPTESYSAMRSRLWEGLYVTSYTRLWSDVPRLRPMMTCLEDTVATVPAGDAFHHHRFGTHCSPETIEMRSGRPGLNACRVNLLQSVKPFGLTEDDLGDNIVIFQKARLDPGDGRWHFARSDAKIGDYIEFYAEIDLLVAVSVCHYDESAENGDYTALPLGIQTYDTGIAPKEYSGWTDWRPEWWGKWVPPQQDGEGI